VRHLGARATGRARARAHNLSGCNTCARVTRRGRSSARAIALEPLKKHGGEAIAQISWLDFRFLPSSTYTMENVKTSLT
jgi:hypothetical protein